MAHLSKIIIHAFGFSPLLSKTSPTVPKHISQYDSVQYRPSKDMDAFNSLLPPPIEFVEGSSSGALAVPEGKYEPINTTPKAPKIIRSENPKLTLPTPAKSPIAPTNSSNTTGASLHPGSIDATWPETCGRGTGLYNIGNTCFLNSALQCLLHTPPLLRVLIAHQNRRRLEGSFCMICSLRQVAVQSHSTKAAFSPSSITSRLHLIAKHMRKGRQEDSHEFLRYAIDALQKSCYRSFALPRRKVDPKLAETTWVHKIFGGQLRSRVTCHDCGFNSDTLDRILDLSLDILKSDTLKDALRKFVAIDYLKGADKYKCEKCKKHVVAEKRFTLHEAPLILTVHLKRFSPLPYMSEGHHGPALSCWRGPNSGHYYAYIKSKDGRWWEANDEAVTSISGAPLLKKTAYMLFYQREKGQGLEAAVNAPMLQKAPFLATTPQKNKLTTGMKKKGERDVNTIRREDEEDTGVKVAGPFIGPLLPSPMSDKAPGPSKTPTLQPQVNGAKQKTTSASIYLDAKQALSSLEDYASDSDGESKPDKPQPVPSMASAAIPAKAFYTNHGSATKKRKSPDSGWDSTYKDRSRIHPAGSNPYNRIVQRKRMARAI
ncbi:hypothetical protein BD779DRAFT_1492604 [Infundibulicybe gibba]|nr:hypothetical protein BD779DRAFT_1492604 [Infundibulicybe gibba]